MPVKYGRFAAATAGGTQTIVTGVGEAIKGVIVYGVMLTGASYGSGYNFSVGAADGAGNDWHLAVGSDDNIATSNTYSYGGTDGLGRHLTAESTYDCIFSVGAFESDGDFTITWGDAPSSAWEFHYLAFWGSDVQNCAARTLNNSTSSGNQAITGVGFQGTWGMLVQAAQTAGSNSGTRLSIGMAASSTQRAMLGFVNADATADGTVGVGQRTDNILGFASSSGTWSRLADFVSWGADGLTINHAAAPPSARPMHLFVVKMDDVWVGSFSADTAGGAQSVSGPAFPASGFLALSRDQVSASTIDTSSANAGKVSLFAGDETDSGGVWISQDDGAATMETNMRNVRSKGMTFSDWPATTDGEATFTPDATGIAVAWTDAPTRASEVILSVFGGGGPTEHLGATASTYTFSATTAGVRESFGATATPIAFTATTAGAREAFGATATPIAFTATTAGVRTAFGATATPITFTATTAGFKEAFGATATPIVFTATTAGFKTAAGATASTYTFSATTAGFKEAFGAAALPIVFSATTAGAVTATAQVLAGDITGDGTLTGALESVPLDLAAALTGDGTLTGNAVLASSQSLSAALTGDGTLTGNASMPSFPLIITVRSRPGVRPRRATGSAFGGGRERSRVR